MTDREQAFYDEVTVSDDESAAVSTITNMLKRNHDAIEGLIREVLASDIDPRLMLARGLSLRDAADECFRGYTIVASQSNLASILRNVGASAEKKRVEFRTIQLPPDLVDLLRRTQNAPRN